ncbi:arginine decarboxylase [Salmonella enterica subsp. enterica]|uniref:Arginine decarboxylase n=1 Tax=Salmonella enterica I TaxID=59201 RepID=A0A379WGD2_SALET|nr:arginine decarboxylase [Salmonella enterica subsp. enterica]
MSLYWIVTAINHRAGADPHWGQPVYMVPSRNRYGIIGPIYPQEMQPETLQKNQRQPADQNQSRTETVLQRGDQLYL